MKNRPYPMEGNPNPGSFSLTYLSTHVLLSRRYFFGTGKVIGLAGVRRSGKTFLFFDTIQRLVAQGVDRRRIIYLPTTPKNCT